MPRVAAVACGQVTNFYDQPHPRTPVKRCPCCGGMPEARSPKRYLEARDGSRGAPIGVWSGEAWVCRRCKQPSDAAPRVRAQARMGSSAATCALYGSGLERTGR